MAAVLLACTPILGPTPGAAIGASVPPPMVAPQHVVAHRGDHGVHMENSLAAYKKALEAGARWLETDVHFTRDGVPVLLHDDSLLRTAGVDRDVGDVNYKDLPRLLDGQRIPKMTELLDLLAQYPKATLFLEVKEGVLRHHSYDETVAQLDNLIRNNPKVVPISFSAELMETWWKLRPRPIGWLGDECERAPKAPLAFILMSSDGFLNRQCGPVADDVVAYTVDDAASIKKLIARGAKLVETNNYSRIQQELGFK